MNWGDSKIEMDGTHPVTYNARGTHATYLSGGRQWYAMHTIFDVCGQGQMWDLQKTLEIIFPWEYLTEDKICKTEGWEGINWLTQIYQWGNEGTGFDIPVIDEQALGGGPSGFLNKGDVGARKRELEALGWMCMGQDTTRCPWPAGVFSGTKPYCAPGFTYSYMTNQCFAYRFGKGDCSCETGCQPSKPGSCGGAYFDVCSGHCYSASCVNKCQAKQLTVDQMMGLDHFVCQRDGTWFNMNDFSSANMDNLTFASGNKLHDNDSFPCQFNAY